MLIEFTGMTLLGALVQAQGMHSSPNQGPTAAPLRPHEKIGERGTPKENSENDSRRKGMAAWHAKVTHHLTTGILEA